jgi:hypothetical protein
MAAIVSSLCWSGSVSFSAPPMGDTTKSAIVFSLCRSKACGARSILRPAASSFPHW